MLPAFSLALCMLRFTKPSKSTLLLQIVKKKHELLNVSMLLAFRSMFCMLLNLFSLNESFC